ncbi:induced myeloid leukemia cell differentiation protein Mcl-1 [Paroedura picta]|uniref:induced myeloid leukemia cell differentiation protein Mcl-1 n=1 Tax=Paroedura picta TaxID=143630 RepID=UPI004056D7F3
MLSLKQKMIGLNLYCGGALAVAPGAQRPAPSPPPPPPPGRGPWPPSEGARALIGGAPGGGAPRALIGPLEGAPRSLIGWAPPLPPSTLALPPSPEDELDGCEPDADPAEEAASAAGPALVPSPTASLPDEHEPDAAAGKEEEGDGDGLRAETLEVLLRYLLHEEGEGEERGAPPLPAPTPPPPLPPRAKGLAALRACAAPSSARVARAVQTLRRVGGGVQEKHRLAFQGMLNKLEIKDKDDLKSISEVATHVFSDGVTNWGRILTLIAFGGFVARHLKTINQESNIVPLAEIITDVLVKDKREWLVSHNGWEGCVKFFHVEDIEGSIRNVLMAFASVAGIGAGLAYMIR